MEDSLNDYRKTLLTARQEAQNSFDKHLISLAGGGLAVSIAFIHNIVGDKPIQATEFLLYAWILWVTAIGMILFSFFSSRLGLDKAIKQVDENKIHLEHPGGIWDRITSILNVLAGLAFILGTISIVQFVIHNLRSPNA